MNRPETKTLAKPAMDSEKVSFFFSGLDGVGVAGGVGDVCSSAVVFKGLFPDKGSSEVIAQDEMCAATWSYQKNAEWHNQCSVTAVLRFAGRPAFPGHPATKI